MSDDLLKSERAAMLALDFMAIDAPHAEPA